MLGLHKDIVELVPYDSSWVEEYKKEERILRNLLEEYIVDIQHVGSTAIPGLSAKPILDIAVAVESKETLIKLIPILTNAGYDVKDSIDINGELLARKGSPECRTHYIHIEVVGSEYWNNHILFRDYLINHTEYIKEYGEMKINAISKFSERKKYTAEKNEFIKNILNLAKDELKK